MRTLAFSETKQIAGAGTSGTWGERFEHAASLFGAGMIGLAAEGAIENIF